MTKEQREKFLQSIAQSPAGEALKDLLEEQIRDLKDATSFSKENFEIEGKASLKAAAKIEKIIYILELLKKPKSEKKGSQYE